jgi:hypothetical protein
VFNLESFPPGFRTGVASEELTAVWREFILAEDIDQRQNIIGEHKQQQQETSKRQRRVALTITHLHLRLPHISSERLALLLELLQSRKFLLSSRASFGTMGNQILWERAPDASSVKCDTSARAGRRAFSSGSRQTNSPSRPMPNVAFR